MTEATCCRARSRTFYEGEKKKGHHQKINKDQKKEKRPAKKPSWDQQNQGINPRQLTYQWEGVKLNTVSLKP